MKILEQKLGSNTWFNLTCDHPPGNTPGDLQVFSFLVVYSPPPGTQKETIPHPCPYLFKNNIDFRAIAKRDAFLTFINVF